jgi:hypothetical protein
MEGLEAGPKETRRFTMRENTWQRRACSLAGASALAMLLAMALHLQSQHHMQRVKASLRDGLLAQAGYPTATKP